MATYEIRIYVYPEHDQLTVCTSEVVAGQSIGFGSPIITTTTESTALMTAVNQAAARIAHRKGED